jgi:ERF superfamily
MKVYRKLMEARINLQGTKLNKSGQNKFAGYQYFELGDFLPAVQSIFERVGLCGVVSFTADMATLTITDIEDGSQIVLTSPMGSAALKGCHEVQNIGAVETYQRRYLWVSAMEIVEHDVLDATTGGDRPKHRPTEGVAVKKERESLVYDVAAAIKDRMDADDVVGAYEEASGITDAEEKTLLWSLLDSKARSSIKKQAQALKEV